MPGIGIGIGIGFGSAGRWTRYWSSRLKSKLNNYWNLNEISGNAIDSWGDKNGTVYNVTQGSPGKIDKSYQFVADGVKRYVSCGAIVSNSYSISLWAKKTIGAINACLIGTGGTYGGLFLNGNLFKVNRKDGTLLCDWAADSWALDDGEFHHIVLTINSVGANSIIDLYYDGLKLIPKIVTAEALERIVIGNIYGNGSYSTTFTFGGNICDVALFDVLDNNEIAALYNYQKGNRVPFLSYSNSSSKKSGYAIFTFDDGLESVYTKIYNEFKVRNQKATFFLRTNAIGTAGYLSWLQANEINSHGFELGSHGQTHTQWETLTEAQLRAELDAVDLAFISNGLATPETAAYPYSNDQVWVELIAAEYYKLVRGTNASPELLPYQKPTNNKFDITQGHLANAAFDDTNVFKRIIDGLYARNSIKVFMLHNIVEANPIEGYERTVAYLTELLDYCNTAKVNVINFKDLYSLMG